MVSDCFDLHRPRLQQPLPHSTLVGYFKAQDVDQSGPNWNRWVDIAADAGNWCEPVRSNVHSIQIAGTTMIYLLLFDDDGAVTSD